ncbi:MAG: TRAP transporter substrate-binding protein DctP [Dehalococcoidia bacterium]|nr:TRAP transporter substrate-binding protein DctP [Dehalococcoidia bacterium]
MTYRRFVVLALLLVALLVTTSILTACAPSAPPAKPSPTAAPPTTTAPAKTWQLKYASGIAPGGWSEEFAKKYCEGVERVTGGQVKIQYFMGGVLGKVQDQINMLASGVADIVYHAPPYTPGLFPLSEISALPFLITEPFKVAQFHAEVSKLPGCTEFKDLKVLAFLATNPVNLYTRSKEIKTAADLKGMKIRGVGGIYSQTIEKLGATPVSIPTAEVYSALDKNVVEGLTTNSNFLTQIKGWEVIKFALRDGINGGVHMMLMSKRVWDSFPPDIQKKIDEYNAVYQKEFITYSSNDDQASFDLLAKNGVKVSKLDPAELKNWREMTASLVSDYEKTLNSKGLPGTDAIALARKIAAS